MNKKKFEKISQKDRLEVVKRDWLICYQCQKLLKIKHYRDFASTIEWWAFHHIIPQIYWWENNQHNVCILCKECHILIHSWSEIIEKYLIHKDNFVLNKPLV